MDVLYIPDMKVYKIYDISYTDNGDPIFLVYRNNIWVKLNAKDFTPNYFETFNGEYCIEPY